MTREPTVFVVQSDTGKDLSEAKKFGNFRAIFFRPVYEKFDRAIVDARKALKDYKDGDYILLIGDPMLCGISMTVALERSDDFILRVLRWDRLRMTYLVAELDFGGDDSPYAFIDEDDL